MGTLFDAKTGLDTNVEAAGRSACATKTARRDLALTPMPLWATWPPSRRDPMRIIYWPSLCGFSARGNRCFGKNQALAIAVGMTALAITVATRKEYWA